MIIIRPTIDNYSSSLLKSWGPIHEAKNKQVSCNIKLQGILEKNTLKKYDLQESYNNCKIEL